MEIKVIKLSRFGNVNDSSIVIVGTITIICYFDKSIGDDGR